MNERIRQIREILSLSRAAFGDELGISGDVVNNLERGRIEIKDERIKLICSTFNVNEDWLRTGKGEMFIEMDKENQLFEWAGRVLANDSDDFKKRFVKMLMSLTEDEWKFIEAKAIELVNNRKD